jgi:hypothetical protein
MAAGCLEFLLDRSRGACRRGSDVVLVESWREAMPPEHLLARARHL